MDLEDIKNALSNNPGKTQSGLAEALGINRSAITRLLKGERRIQREEEAIINAYLGLSSSPMVRMTPVLSWVQAGAFTETSSSSVSAVVSNHFDATSMNSLEKIPVVDVKSPHIFALEVRGSSMNLIAPEGSHIVVDYADKELIDGKCYVVMQGDDSTFKRYRANPTRLEPVSSDPGHETIFPENGTTVVGRVLKVVSDL